MILFLISFSLFDSPYYLLPEMIQSGYVGLPKKVYQESGQEC